jgi:glucosamine-6-phosphate deaminase
MHASSSNPLSIHVGATRSAMGARAASDIASEIRALLRTQADVHIMFAAAPSQAEMLASLIQQPDIDWSRITALHMDEYLGLAQDAPQRFGNWLRNAIFDHLPFRHIHLIAPELAADQAVAHYTSLLAAPLDIVCCGVGINGHLAFNDPPADFNDPLLVKVIALDQCSREQQVSDGCFASIDAVPRQAITVTIRVLLSARTIFCTVPGAPKNQAIRNLLEGPITESCPATALRLHPRCTLYLDPDSAAGLSFKGHL